MGYGPTGYYTGHFVTADVCQACSHGSANQHHCATPGFSSIAYNGCCEPCPSGQSAVGWNCADQYSGPSFAGGCCEACPNNCTSCADFGENGKYCYTCESGCGPAYRYYTGPNATEICQACPS